MADIAGPKHPAEHRDTDCQFALEPAFQELLQQSVRAGWDESLASRALIGLAKARLAGIDPEEATGDEIEKLARWTP
jgi:hypothetical protein